MYVHNVTRVQNARMEATIEIQSDTKYIFTYVHIY